MTIEELELEVIQLRDRAAEAGNDELWQFFATGSAVIAAVLSMHNGDHDEGCDIGPGHTGNCSVPLV